VTTSNAVAAKAALFDALAEEAQSGLLQGLDVHYAWPGEVSAERVVYGGGFRFEQQDAVAEQGVLIDEVVEVSLYVRIVKRPAVDVRETDLEAADVLDLIGTVFASRRQLAGPYTWMGVVSGMGDYSRTADETTSVLAAKARIGTRLSWFQ
jgi:hypothetical protein